jgi:hypothetical protein
MKNHDDEENYDDRPRKKRRKSKKRGGFPGWLIALLFVLLLAGGGVAVVVVILQGKDELLTKACERWQGTWQGTSKEHPSLQLRMEVFPEKLRFGAVNVKINQGDTFTHVWKPLRVTGNTLVIRQHREGSTESHDWSIEFKSDDQMSVTSLSNMRTLGDYTRVRMGKQGNPER